MMKAYAGSSKGGGSSTKKSGGKSTLKSRYNNNRQAGNGRARSAFNAVVGRG